MFLICLTRTVSSGEQKLFYDRRGKAFVECPLRATVWQTRGVAEKMRDKLADGMFASLLAHSTLEVVEGKLEAGNNDTSIELVYTTIEEEPKNVMSP